MQDKTLTCKDCGEEFVFSASEQEFYAEKGFQNEPSRCPACRKARKQQAGGRGRSNNNRAGGFRQERELHDAVCSNCGTQTKVPFKPNGMKPIYCRDCYQR